MKTEILQIDKDNIDINKMKKAADIIKNGGLVAFPTETVYGLGADGLSSKAVEKIFTAKGRPADNPLILHISDISMLDKIVISVSQDTQKLIERFWPGPLTIIFNKKPSVPDSVTCGLLTVAVRMPSHPVAHTLISLSKTPIAAPSANLSGKPSPTCANHVCVDLDGKVDLIIDSLGVDEGLESTVIDMTCIVPEILRPGSITIEDIKIIIKDVVYDKALQKNSRLIPKSPGQKYRHYSPAAKLHLVLGSKENFVLYANEILNKYIRENKNIFIICSEDTKALINRQEFAGICSYSDIRGIAKNFYHDLRNFDSHAADIIIVEGVLEKGLGHALMNRARKAASEIIEID